MKYDEHIEEYLLSVIVPFYNVENYLKDCIDSIATAIEGISAEVILVDDGSVDNSTAIAVSYTDSDKRFKYYRKENGGASDARNYGVNISKGRYISFIDADDLVTSSIFRNMIVSAEANDADMTSVNVARYSSKGTWNSPLHQRVFDHIKDPVTHITECDDLIYDTTAANKLIRAEFYKSNGFEFPVGWRFEDIYLSLLLHYYARRVSVVRETGYLWRVREDGSLSTTQQNDNSVNLKHRLEMLRRLFAFIDEKTGDKEHLRSILKEKILNVDLMLYINKFPKLEDEIKDEFRELITGFCDEFYSSDDFNDLSALFAQKYDYLFSGKYEELDKVIDYGRNAYFFAPYTEDDEGRLGLDLPEELFTADKGKIENEFNYSYPKNNIIDVSVKDEKLVIEAYIYEHRINAGSPEENAIDVSLENIASGRSITLKADRPLDDIITKRYGFLFGSRDRKISEYNYDYAVYRIIIDPADIDPSFCGRNVIMVSCKNQYSNSSVILRNRKELSRICTDGSTAASGGRRCSLKYDQAGHVLIDITDFSDGSSVYMPEKPYLSDIDGEPLLHICGKDHLERTIRQDSYAFIEEHSTVPLVLDLKVDLYDKASDLQAADLVYYNAYDAVFVPVGHAVPQKKENITVMDFTVDFSDECIVSNIYDGIKQLLLQVTDKNGEKKQYEIFSDGRSVDSLEFDNFALKFMAFDNRYHMVPVSDWDHDVNSKSKRSYCRLNDYKADRKLPLDDNLILIESDTGYSFGGNPAALYEYIDRNYPSYNCVISLRDVRTPVNGNAKRVLKYSKEYYHYLATARFLINDTNFEKTFVKRKKQIFLQTMNGTPYEKTGLESETKYKTEKSLDTFLKKNLTWDYLAVQGEFSRSMAGRWFNYDNRFLEYGCPKTDILFSPDTNRISEIRSGFDIRPDKKVIFMDIASANGTFLSVPADIDELRNALGSEWVILLRTKSDDIKRLADGIFVTDVSGYRNDDELLLISDIFVTDHSALMFDHLLTKKPLIFLAAADDGTGYVDLSSEAPGPVVSSAGELVSEIDGIDIQIRKYKAVRNRFRKRYLTYESRNSCRSILRKFLSISWKKR